MKNQREVGHTFAICAYKESPYLEECILSLKAQTITSQIMIGTSTPNAYIEGLGKKYDIPIYVNEGEGGITQDWNFAYEKAGTSYITIAHQDDIYEPDYLETVLELLGKTKKPLLFFSDYYEIRGERKTAKTKNLRIKRMMLYPLRFRIMQKSRWVRRRILSLGSPICCPSVTYVADNLPRVIFKNEYQACEDWQAWEKLSRLHGSFVFAPNLLMGHRIHKESETSAAIENDNRTREEYEMFCKFWPNWIARILGRWYATGQDSNQL